MPKEKQKMHRNCLLSSGILILDTVQEGHLGSCCLNRGFKGKTLDKSESLESAERSTKDDIPLLNPHADTHFGIPVL